MCQGIETPKQASELTDTAMQHISTNLPLNGRGFGFLSMGLEPWRESDVKDPYITLSGSRLKNVSILCFHIC